MGHDIVICLDCAQGHRIESASETEEFLGTGSCDACGSQTLVNTSDEGTLTQEQKNMLTTTMLQRCAAVVQAVLATPEGRPIDDRTKRIVEATKYSIHYASYCIGDGHVDSLNNDWREAFAGAFA